MVVVSGVVVVLVVAFVVWTVVNVRRLRRAGARADAALTLVYVELDRRYEYVPALALAAAATVGRDLVAPVTGARAMAMRVREENLGPGRQAGAEKALSAAVQAVLDVGRRYPQLRSDWAFVRPAHELELIDQRLTGAVRVYNDQARALGRLRRTFPLRIVARWAGIGEAPLFEATILTVPASDSTPAVPVIADAA